MRDTGRHILGDESGQDLVEYTLLLAFVLLVGLSVFEQTGTAVGPAWTSANTILQAASAAS
jgi:Flp pilus assembly pilin Flp